ncbi:MAG: histidinol dehydrogenase, partial [Oscillospiraceae bacterium]
MIRIKKGDKAYCESFIAELKGRISESDSRVEGTVSEILKAVKLGGDEAIRAYSMKFDGWCPNSIE